MRAGRLPRKIVNTFLPDKALGKAAPYGVLDLAADEGFVSVGISNDTAEFSVASIRSWWEHLGKVRYANATTLMITADCGGSNGNRTRLWKTGLQNLADETGLAISVSHFPPGTRNGTRSSTASGASSRATGAASHWSATR